MARAGYGTPFGINFSRHERWLAKLGRDLLTAAEEGNTSIVKACLEQKAHPGSIDLPTGRSVLHMAADAGSEQVMALVVSFGIPANTDFSALDRDSRTPLDAALEAPLRLNVNVPVAVPLLVAAGEALEVANELKTSAAKWRKALLAVLESCPSPVPMAHEAALQLVLKNWVFTGAGGGPPSLTQELRRALFTCIAKNNVGGTEALAAAGVDLNRLDPRSCRTPRELAEALQHNAIMEVLRKYRASSQRNPDFEQWALCLAASMGDEMGAWHWMSYGEVDWREPPPSNRGTALMYAAAGAHTDIVQALLKEKACPALIDAKSQTPADMARKAGAEPLAQYLERLADLWMSQHEGADIEPETWQEPIGWRKADPEVDTPESLIRPQAEQELQAEDEPQEQEPPKGKKKLEIEVISAEGLKTSTFQFSLDPMVKIRIGREIQETQYIVGDQNPVWNSKHTFEVEGTEVIIFQIWDADRTGLGDHDFIGRCELPLKKVVRDLFDGTREEVEMDIENQTKDDSGANLFVALQLPDQRRGKTQVNRTKQQSLEAPPRKQNIGSTKADTESLYETPPQEEGSEPERDSPASPAGADFM